MKVEQEIKPRLLTPIQTATYLCISERKLWSLTKDNQIPHLRIGRSVRYAVGDVDRWIEEKRIDSE